MNIFKKSLALASTMMLIAGPLASGAAAQGTDIAGNGAFSANTVTQSDSQTNTTVQSNSATFNNSINVSSDTGNNTANYNTGGNVGIGTGNSITGVQITNMANANMASPNMNSTMPNPQLPVTIQGNGAGSDNSFSSSNSQDQSVYQTNTANFTNSVAADSNTGSNSANYGTNGNSTIMTGQSQTVVGIQNTANGNVFGNTMPMMGAATQSPSTTGTVVLNNGAFSANTVGITNTDSTLVEQSNDAVLNNAIAADSNTGANTADQNTGGSQLITTGPVNLTAGINNMANFNSASLDPSSWLTSADPVIYGNGAYSASSVDLAQENTNSLFQGSGNEFTANNALTFTPVTGGNTTDLNTLPKTGFSEVLTGPSSANVLVSNSGNVNNAGNLGSFTLPGGMMVNLGFNLGTLFHL